MNQPTQQQTIFRQANLIAFNSADLNDVILGTGGNDILGVRNQRWNTLIRADAGDDQIVGGAGNDLIRAGDGDDIVQAGGGDDVICGDDGEDVIWGDTGNDFLLGYAGSDRLYGGNGNDILEGGAGNDLLKGGEGRDMLCGGPGNDLFVFSRGDGIDAILSILALRDSEMRGKDTVLFTDVEPDQLRSVMFAEPSASGVRDLIVRYGDNDVLTISEQDYKGGALIDSFRFSNGAELKLALLLELYEGDGGTLARYEPTGVAAADALAEFQAVATTPVDPAECCTGTPPFQPAMSGTPASPPWSGDVALPS